MTTTLGVLPLLEVLLDYARDADLLELIEPSATERQRCRLLVDVNLELGLISWPPGTGTGWHDHGTARGAFATLQGELTEHSWDGGTDRRLLAEGDAWAFPAGHVHDVRNERREPALSLHAYTPRLAAMTHYQVGDGGAGQLVDLKLDN